MTFANGDVKEGLYENGIFKLEGSEAMIKGLMTKSNPSNPSSNQTSNKTSNNGGRKVKIKESAFEKKLQDSKY